MKATELLAISNENQFPIEKIYEQCMLDAKSGMTESVFFTHMSVEIISELGNNGFRVSQTKDTLGKKVFVVSWF